MISFFRRIFQSKIGLAFTFAFIALIALAFASSDVANNATFGGVAGNDRIAVVGDERIDSSELAQLANSALNQVRQERPTTTMPMFLEQGGLEEVLTQLVDRYAIAGYAREYGLRSGDNLINSEILQIPAFRGPSGEFDQATYQNALRNQNLTDAMLRRDLGDGLLAQQILLPSISAAEVPRSIARRYTALLRERRNGSIALIPSTAYAPDGDPTEEQLSSFYDDNRGRYIQPERRTIRYATFSDENLDARIEPTQAEIAARYERDADQYAAQESRSISSFIVPTEEAANAIREQVSSGTSLEAAAKTAGFTVSASEGQSKSALASATSSAVADAVFAASEGEVAAPARSSLGWYVARVDDIERTPARTLAQVTPEITEQLTIEKRAAALSDFSARIEEQVDGGVSLSDVAEEFGLNLQTTPELLADGRVFGQDGQTVAPELQSALQTAFDMEESEPQLAEVVRGQVFLVFEVPEITPSATSPLADIRDRVEFDWRLFEGSELARAAAERILERMGSEESLAAAVNAEEVNLPPIERIDLDRTELLQQRQRVAPPLALLFSMAEGTTKRLEAANRLGWFVVDLDEISVDEIADDDPLFEATLTQLSPAVSNEYAEQLTTAMREELGVERNEDAIEAVRKQLAGET